MYINTLTKKLPNSFNVSKFRFRTKHNSAHVLLALALIVPFFDGFYCQVC